MRSRALREINGIMAIDQRKAWAISKGEPGDGGNAMGADLQGLDCGTSTSYCQSRVYEPRGMDDLCRRRTAG
jgi:hypothetical protein